MVPRADDGDGFDLHAALLLNTGLPRPVDPAK